MANTRAVPNRDAVAARINRVTTGGITKRRKPSAPRKTATPTPAPTPPPPPPPQCRLLALPAEVRDQIYNYVVEGFTSAWLRADGAIFTHAMLTDCRNLRRCCKKINREVNALMGLRARLYATKIVVKIHDLNFRPMAAFLKRLLRTKGVDFNEFCWIGDREPKRKLEIHIYMTAQRVFVNPEWFRPWLAFLSEVEAAGFREFERTCVFKAVKNVEETRDLLSTSMGVPAGKSWVSEIVEAFERFAMYGPSGPPDAAAVGQMEDAMRGVLVRRAEEFMDPNYVDE